MSQIGFCQVITQSSYLRIVIFQVIKVRLGLEEQLHDGRGIWHELEQERRTYEDGN